MNRKIFGIKLGTIISLTVCLAVSFLIWLYANYTAMTDETLFANALSLISRG